jgi:plastocyanin
MAKIFTRWRWMLMAWLGLAVATVPAPAGSNSPVERTIRVEASSYEYAPAILKANPGDRVTLELASTDVVHGIYIDGYELELRADPGQTQEVTFVADKEGSFRLRCSVTCGPLHPFMIGKLQVGQNWLLWRSVVLAFLGIFAILWLRRTSAST